MYLRTIGRLFTQMIAYFLVMNGKRCNTTFGYYYLNIIIFLLTYCSVQVSNKTIRSYKRLELQGMYPFVDIVDDLLILEWEANRADSAINETPAVIQRRTLLMDCICICS